MAAGSGMMGAVTQNVFGAQGAPASVQTADPYARPQPATTVEGVKCTNCGNVVSGKFCPECGTLVPVATPEVKKCANCGLEVSGKFCSNCGTPVA